MSIVKYCESHYVTVLDIYDCVSGTFCVNKNSVKRPTSSPRVLKAQWLEHPTGVTEVSPRGKGRLPSRTDRDARQKF